MPIAPLDLGSRLRNDRFVVTGVVGEGGFSITYEAFDLWRAGERVVIKEHAYEGACYRNTSTGHVTARAGHVELHGRLVKRVMREAAVLQRVRHRHVIGVHDAWEERGTAYYAMESLIGSGTLHRDVVQGGSIRANPARWAGVHLVALQLLAALKACHLRGCYHCDVKPDNVLIASDRGLVLIDFGAVRSDEQLLKTVTLMPFTRGYAAPELTVPDEIRNVGPATDIYAWGMLIHGLIAGHGDSGQPLEASIRIALQATRRTSPSTSTIDPYDTVEAVLLGRGVPAKWAKIIHAAVQLDRSARPQSVAAIEAAVGERTDEVTGRPPPVGALVAADLQRGSDPALVSTVLAPTAASAGQANIETEVSAPLVDPVPPTVVRTETAVPQRQPVERRRASPGSLLLVAGGIAMLLTVGFLAARHLGGGGPELEFTAMSLPDGGGRAPEVPPPEGSAAPAASFTCPKYQVNCDGQCKHKNDPVWACGRCSPPCRLDHVESHACDGTACAVGKCTAPWKNCDNTATNGCEVDSASDTANCGQCGTDCMHLSHVSTATCSDGTCGITACETGFGDCDGLSNSGCEANLLVEVPNCGKCASPCAPPHANPACDGGHCGISSCVGNWRDCDRAPANGCESDVMGDKAHCGACNNACEGASRHVSSARCESGSCTNVVCAAGWKDCDDSASDCETNIRTSQNCGDCAVTCVFPGATATCVSGVCQFGGCKAGFSDCDNAPTNGCEVHGDCSSPVLGVDGGITDAALQAD